MVYRRTVATRIGRAILVLVLLTCSLFLPHLQAVKQIDDRLVAFRFQSAPRTASQQLAFVAIDKRSLDAVGTWPWPRGVHAQLVDKLVAGGVRDIFLDIDFSTPSSKTQDDLLARSLSDAGGGVILPVFAQRLAATAGSEPVITQPISSLSSRAWLASANVNLDADGLVRQFELGTSVSGNANQSVSSVLAKSNLSSGSLPLDLSIQPASVPTYSVSDVLSGSVGADQLKGRSVIVGAYATELKDTFAVPVYGALSGPMINILGAETLIQNRLLHDVDMTAFQLLLAGTIIVGALALRNRPVSMAIAIIGAMGFALEFAAYIAQKNENLLLHTATSWVLLLVGLFLVMNEQLDLSGLIADFANAEQRNTRRLLQKVVADNADAVIIFDHRLQVVERSQAATLLFGPGACQPRATLQDFAPTEVLVTTRSLISDLKHYPTRSHASGTEFLLPIPEGTGHFEADVTLSPIEAEKWTVEAGSFVGCLTIRDVTARQLYQRKLQQLAENDELTGLLNRREFTARLARLYAPHCVVAIDLHRFSVLNATLGRAKGDSLLRAVGQRLLSLDKASLVGNFGGDLFCAALKMTEHQSAVDCATRLLADIEHPFWLGETDVQTTARLGYCETHRLPAQAQLWVEAAEQALDEAKTIAGRGMTAYDPSAALRQARSRRLERDMRQGLDNSEFFLLYQPHVDLRSGKITGAEALIRWQHPELGLVSPLEFIAIAESNGFISDIGRFVLLKACMEAATWPSNISVAVNVSPIQFAKADIVSDVHTALEAAGLDPRRLTLEITESAFVSRTDELVRSLSELRNSGITIALDDFGTGYSSLSYIAGFPLDKLKIDQSFIKKMMSDPGSQAIVQAISALAHSLNLDIVAEGIETELEWKMLALIGCEFGQGYYFGKPQTTQELVTLAGSEFVAEAVQQLAQQVV